MSTLKTTAIQHLNGSSPNINLDANNNVTVPGTLNVSSGIFASTLSPYIFNKPSPSGYQTVMRVGSSNEGLYFTSDSALISKGCYYDNGWIATSATGNLLNFSGSGIIEHIYFTGATVGSAPTMVTNSLVHTGNFSNSKASNGYTYLPNGVILQWGYQTVGPDRSSDYSFPISFPSSCYGFGVSGDWSNQDGWIAAGGRPLGPSTYRLYNVLPGNIGVWWMAIGY